MNWKWWTFFSLVIVGMFIFVVPNDAKITEYLNQTWFMFRVMVFCGLVTTALFIGDSMKRRFNDSKLVIPFVVLLCVLCFIGIFVIPALALAIIIELGDIILYHWRGNRLKVIIVFVYVVSNILYVEWRTRR